MTTPSRPILRSQRLRLVNHQGDALRLGMNWTEEDLGKPQVLVDSVYGMGHPGTFHFRELIEEVSNGVYEAGGKPGVFSVSDICDGVIQATSGMSYSLVSRDIMAAMVEIHALGHPRQQQQRGEAADTRTLGAQLPALDAHELSCGSSVPMSAPYASTARLMFFDAV